MNTLLEFKPGDPSPAYIIGLKMILSGEAKEIEGPILSLAKTFFIVVAMIGTAAIAGAMAGRAVLFLSAIIPIQ